MSSRGALLLKISEEPEPTRRNFLMAQAESRRRKKYQPRVKMAGKVAGPNAQTNFLNSNRRRIYRSAGGRFFVRTAEGKKQYSPKAAYHVNKNTGSTGPVSSYHAIPQAIRPKGLPRKRVARGTNMRVMFGEEPLPMGPRRVSQAPGLGRTIGKNLALLFAEPAAPARRGRKSKYATNANRKAARAAYAKKYRANIKAGVRAPISRALPRNTGLFA